MKKTCLFLMIALISIFLGACSSEDNSTKSKVEVDPWVGVWLSTGDNVALILSYYFQYDSVRVTMNEDMTIVLESHVMDGAWSTTNGVYTITESEEGNVHAIAINYTAFEQEGIIEITEGDPDVMKLEAVQTVPNIGATPRTVENGFGSDATLGDSNIQTYVRID